MSEIFLMPGDFYFGNEYSVVKTLLGSCVAITMWNGRLRVGGMCHYKLPRRLNKTKDVLDGSYGEDAIQLFELNMNRFMLKPCDMEVGVFGAGNMFADVINNPSISVSAQNIRLANTLLSDLGFKVLNESLGGDVSRRITLNLDTGEVILKSLLESESFETNFPET